MKKLMSTMLALALVVGTATVTFAQADGKDSKDKAATKRKGGKKKGDAKDGDAKDGKDAKGGKKGKDADKK